jgi:hypothetical protein
MSGAGETSFGEFYSEATSGVTVSFDSYMGKKRPKLIEWVIQK